MSVGIVILGTSGLTASISSSALIGGMNAERLESVGPGGPASHLGVAHRRRGEASSESPGPGHGGKIVARSGIRPLYLIARNGASSTCRATGRRLARCSASVAPVENPMTATGVPCDARSSKASSTPRDQSSHAEGGMIGPGGVVPRQERCGDAHSDRANAAMSGSSSYGPPPSPCSTSTAAPHSFVRTLVFSSSTSFVPPRALRVDLSTFPGSRGMSSPDRFPVRPGIDLSTRRR